MVEDFIKQLDIQEQILIELEDELEMEISRVIALKNSINPELIEDLEKIEEGLYVEVKMIAETKKNIDILIKKFKNDDGTPKDIQLIEKPDIDKHQTEVDKYRKRSEKLAKQLITANEEIETLKNKMDSEIKNRENMLKDEFITKLQEKDRNINEKLMEAKRREEQLATELASIKTQGYPDSEELERMKEFFDKKIKNIKKSMKDEFSKREKEIAEKAVTVYNRKKERVYEACIKNILNMNNHPPEADAILNIIREQLNLLDNVYDLDNYSLCESCGEAVHFSQTKCPNCKAKFKV